jgi:hypothetical protein
MKGMSLPFGHRPDPVLGTALRQVLSAEDHSTFVARVMAATAAPHPVHWDILAHWARRSAGAACAAAFVAGLLVGATQPAPVDLVSPVASPSAHALLPSIAPPDVGALLVPEELR